MRHLIALFVSLSLAAHAGWVPTSKANPKEDVTVLLWGPALPVTTGIFTRYMDTGKPVWMTPDGPAAVDFVTHWAPLPKPPRRKATAKGK